ncbi:AraC family transcriptional regulator [Pseudophaeobacter sp.]|uniref:AraC family transcriptional regulator n=1 Tax=Pseudophaeobacter sp. TaxID=1971739 RepID=UPI0032973015
MPLKAGRLEKVQRRLVARSEIRRPKPGKKIIVLNSAPSENGDTHCLYEADKFARDHRMVSWQNHFSHIWGPANVSAVSKTAFGASMESASFGRLRLNKVRLRGQRITRKRGHSELLDGSFHALNIVHEGEGLLTTHDANTSVRAGEMLFSSSPEGNSFAVPGDFVATQVMIPSDILADYIPGTPGVLLFHENASSLKMSLLRAILQQLCKASKSGTTDAATIHLIEKHLLELLALAVEMEECTPVSDETSVCFAHRLRIQRIIREHLVEPDLAPTLIAQLGGLSESYLHRVFNTSGVSVMQTVRTLRLEKARELLATTNQPRLSMGQIAYMCGFASHSSFTRSFQKHYGVAPKDMRNKLSLPR